MFILPFLFGRDGYTASNESWSAALLSCVRTPSLKRWRFVRRCVCGESALLLVGRSAILDVDTEVGFILFMAFTALNSRVLYVTVGIAIAPYVEKTNKNRN